MHFRRARHVPAWLLPGLVLSAVVWSCYEFPLRGLPSAGRATCHDHGFFLASESEKGCLDRSEGPQQVRAQAILAVSQSLSLACSV